MRRAVELQPKTMWPDEVPVSSVTLTFDARHRRRIRMTDDDGEAFLLDLPLAMVFEHGDGLKLEDGGFIEVRAADEPVADVSAGAWGDLARLAWHIGNRHEPVQIIDEGRLRVRDDHVLLDMLRGLGATITPHMAPFSPERGAYSPSSHDHDHGEAERDHG